MLQRFVDASKRTPVLRLSVNGTPLELPLELLARTVREHAIPDIVYNRSMQGLSPQERTWRLTMKGGIDVTLALIESEILEHQADVPLPVTDPKQLEQMGHDILTYGMEYLWGLILSALNETAVDATAHVEERPDGTAVIVIDSFVSRPSDLAAHAELDAAGADRIDGTGRPEPIREPELGAADGSDRDHAAQSAQLDAR